MTSKKSTLSSCLGRWPLAAAVLASVLFVLPTPPATAAPGDLDTTFDTDGKATTRFPEPEAAAKAVAVQGGGKVVAVGTAAMARGRGADFGLARYGANGTLDTTFGAGGTTLADFDGRDDDASAMVVRADNRIVVAGTSCTPLGGDCRFALAGFTADGAPDLSFGVGGKVFTQLPAGISNATALGMALYPPDPPGTPNGNGGKIVVSGTVVSAQWQGTNAPALVRYLSTGLLDTTFGSTDDGMVIGAGDDVRYKAVVVQPNGLLVVLSENNLLRYTAGDALDTDFGTGGAAPLNLAGTATAVGLYPQGDPNGNAGKVVVGGQTGFGARTGTPSEFVLARFTSSGSSDGTFGGAGRVITDFLSQGASIANAKDVVVEPGGKVLVGGEACGGDPQRCDFALARYGSDGALDQGFGTGGLVTTAFGTEHSRAAALAIYPAGDPNAGKIVAAGDVVSALAASPRISGSDFAVARYQSPAPLVGATTSASTSTVTAAPTSVPADGATASTITVALKDAAGNPVPGKAVSLEATAGPGSPTIGSASGPSDSSGEVRFGVKSTTAGTNTFTATDTTDSVTVTDTADVTFTSAGTPVAPRSGIPDPAFGAGGKVTTGYPVERPGAGGALLAALSAVAVQPDGKLVAAGWDSLVGDFVVARYEPDGELDEAFGDRGMAATDFGATADVAAGLSVRGQGLVLGGTSCASTRSTTGDLVRRVVERVLDQAQQGTPEVDDDCRFALAGYTTDGRPDPFFGTGGQVRTDLGGPGEPGLATVLGMAVYPSSASGHAGKLLLSGMVERKDSTGSERQQHAVLVRYLPNGQIDSTFGTQGMVVTTFAGETRYNGVVVQADGRAVAVGNRSVIGFTVTGSIDPNFGSGGQAPLASAEGSARSIALYPSGDPKGNAGKVAVVVGEQFVVERLTSSGATDPSFGGHREALTRAFSRAGAASAQARAVVVEPDGSVVAAGDACTSGVCDFALARYLPDGTLDRGFGAGGVAVTPFPDGASGIAALAVYPPGDPRGNAGKVVAAGWARAARVAPAVPIDPTDFALARYLMAPPVGPVSASMSTISASPASVPADGATTSTVTATLRDADGNPVSGNEARLAKTGGPGSPHMSIAWAPSDSAGRVHFSVRSSTPGTNRFAVTDTTDSVTITSTAQVVFTAPATSGSSTASTTSSGTSSTTSSRTSSTTSSETSSTTGDQRDASGDEAAPESRDGYRLVAADGGIFSFGRSIFLGSGSGRRHSHPFVGTADAASSSGYWAVASDGTVLAFGGAPAFTWGAPPKLNAPIVGMASTPSGKGYWLVAEDGGVFTFGDARFFGSTGGIRLARPVVSMASTPSGRGYWLVASDGGVFAFGDARFAGSTGGRRLTKPVVAMAGTPSGNGYWLAASDGGVFAFGDAPFRGSTGAIRLNRPIVSMASTRSGKGYWLAASDGGIFAFGDAPFLGSTGAISLSRPIVGMAGR
ncbi:MAG TPA: invasin domain 3-containing protein [Acidimicrobiales bacterium]|nr:invasin domain 3-containing protein [Acidimicrobiales bacterium]